MDGATILPGSCVIGTQGRKGLLFTQLPPPSRDTTPRKGFNTAWSAPAPRMGPFFATNKSSIHESPFLPQTLCGLERPLEWCGCPRTAGK